MMLDDINKKNTSILFDCETYVRNDREDFKRFMFYHMKHIPADNKLYFPVVFYEGRYLKSYKNILDYL
jgi:hypothetical protein